MFRLLICTLCLTIIISTNNVAANKIHKIFFYTEIELNSLFNSSLCLTENDIPLSEDESSEQTSPENSPMVLIHDLVVYNKIEYQYQLIAEDGPPHNRWYTVLLRLGDPEWDPHSEEFKGYGSKIKDARKDAAKNALLHTTFPRKPKENEEDLNDHSYCKQEGKTASCQLKTIVDDANRKLFYKKFRPDRGDMYGVQLVLDHQTFKGDEFTLLAAKEVVARAALAYLANEDKDVCIADDIPHNDEDIECTALKSPITLLHELAQQYNYQIKYTVTGDEGPPHKKVFTMACKMGEFESTGDGKSKKLAKTRASENMLEILSKFDYPLPSKTPEEQRRRSRKKRNKMEKASNINSENMERNPIKILYEWASVNGNGEEPSFVFEDVADTEGPSKRFKAECIFKGQTATGFGHKKKIAKQNAALEMLNLSSIPYSDEVKSKEPLISRTYIPGLLKAPDYLLRAGISPENENYDSRSTRLEKLNKKLKKAAEHFTAKETPSAVEESIYKEIMENNMDITNPVRQLEHILGKMGVKLQYMNLPMHVEGTHLSVVWLFTKPELVCYGRPGGTNQEAQENSALATLTFLSELTLANNSTSNGTESKD